MGSVDSDELEGLPRLGAILAGKYRIERVLGAGGMGAVFSATHLALGQRVAIKFLRGASALDPAVVERFSREAWAASRIQNDHVARVVDVSSTDRGAPFLVMEHLQGEDLEAALSRGPLPVRTAVDYVLQACEALAEAHQLGIVHRDLKPSNLFLTHRADGSPWIKVLDFGISKITGAAKLTATSALMGSPLYMSPEHLNATPLDARADIWGLGVILFELISGGPPFVGETLPQICVQILHAEPLPLNRADMPPGLERVIRRCLAKSADHRYPDLAHLAIALAPFGGDDAQASVRFVSNVFGRASLASMPTLETELPFGALGEAQSAHQTPLGGMPTLKVPARSGRDDKIGSSTEVPVSTMSAPRRRRQGLWGLFAGLALSIGGAATLYVLLSDSNGTPVSTFPVAESRPVTVEDRGPAAGEPRVAPGSLATAQLATTSQPEPSATPNASALSASASATASAEAPPPPVIPVKKPPPPVVKQPSSAAKGSGEKGDPKWSPFDDR
jgi:eukaryotic-like serine/threonine-protein kinase